MIIEGLLLGGALGKTFYSADKSLKMNEKALGKYAKSFERSEEAELLIRKKDEFTDKRLVNVAKKRRAIVQGTVPKFAEVYSKIKNIQWENMTTVNEIAIGDNVRKFAIINVPVVDKNGEICESTMEMIVTAEEYLERMNQNLKV